MSSKAPSDSLFSSNIGRRSFALQSPSHHSLVLSFILTFMNISDPTLVVCEKICQGFNLVKNLLWRKRQNEIPDENSCFTVERKEITLFSEQNVPIGNSVRSSCLLQEKKGQKTGFCKLRGEAFTHCSSPRMSAFSLIRLSKILFCLGRRGHSKKVDECTKEGQQTER